MKRILHIILLLGLLAQPAKAQEDRVKLISAKSAQLIDKDGESYRKVVGPAKFFHNNTYLLCDTALWNVNTNIIDAIGHVKIIQERTKLTSSTLQYIVDDNLAKFRGDLVQLEDDEHNTLRTKYLDYNTKDSVAIFQDGAAMRDKDGQVIESLYGSYDSKAHLFVFNDEVNMYLDTTFVKTSRVEYRSDLSTAYFGFGTDMWQDDKMLSANDGWYRRPEELFFFRRDVHLLTEEQESWSDTLLYNRRSKDVEMMGKVEVMDTTRNVYALAGKLEYCDSLSQVKMTRDPAIMSITEEKGRRDSLYIGGDILKYRTVKKCDIPESTVAAAKKRLSDISGDPVSEYRRKAAAEAAAAAAAEADKAGKGGAPAPPQTPPRPGKPQLPDEDESAEPAASDTSAVASAADTVKVEPPKDTTKVGFLWGSKNVRLFRRDMQMASDSLSYCDLDSLIRVYQDPVFYNEGNKQYASDSIYMVVKDKRMERAHLLSNAFITIEEDPSSYDQIRGTEMVAYFDSTAALTRFDALGGASSIFYLVEKDALATVNKVEAKMIYATFKDNELERIHYYDNPKNDGYPTVQLPEDEKQLKGFRWDPDRRPVSPKDVTLLEPRPSQRTSYLDRPHTRFVQTDIYFPGHIKKVYRDIALRDSMKVVRARMQMMRDSLAAIPAVADTASAAAPLAPTTDSLAVAAPADSLKATPDSLSVKPAAPAVTAQPSEKELRAKEKARIKAQKREAREAKWAEKDRIWAEKQAAKQEKAREKERQRKLKALRRLERKAQKEKALLEKYIEKQKKKKITKQH